MLFIGVQIVANPYAFGQNAIKVSLDSLTSESIQESPPKALQKLLLLEKELEKSFVDSIDFQIKMKKANVLDRLDQFDKSLEIWYSLLSRYKKNNDAKKIAKISDEISNHFFATGRYQEALDILIDAKKICIENKAYGDTLKLNMEIGLNKAGVGDFKNSIFILENNIKTAFSTGDREAWIHGVDNLGNVYHELGDYKKSLGYQLELLKSDEVQNSDYLKMAIYQHITELNIELKDYDTAQKYLDLAFELGKVIKSKDWLFEFHKNQYQILKAKGKNKEALYHHEKFQSLKDSVFSANLENKITGLSSLYELEQKQSKIELLNTQQALSSVKIQRLTLGLFLLGFLAASVYLFNIYRQRHLEKKRQEKFSQALLHTQENERKRIAKELHDSIGQNILFIKNQVQKIFADEQVQLSQSIDQTLESVRSISKELYPMHLEKFGLEKSIEILANQISDEFNIFVSSDLQDIDTYLDKEDKINVFRIVQEFINNSLKHAKATAIRITSELKDKNLCINLQDNGSGFNVDLATSKSNLSVGLFSIEERVKAISATISMSSDASSGTQFLITKAI
jgi:signal transduction histidine kinase